MRITTRREALRCLLLLAAGGLMGKSSHTPESRKGKVIVVGAGIAGIAAARQLAAKGLEVVVLDARDRIGGRIWTDRSLGIPIDLGASWIQGATGNPISKLAREFEIQTRRTDFDSVYLYDADGTRASDAEAEEIASAAEEVFAEVAYLAEELEQDISIAAALQEVLRGETWTREEQRALNWAISILELEAAADLEQLSLLGYMEEGEETSGDDLLFPGGYVQIVERLAKGLDIRLAEKVTEIRHGKEGVQVRSAGGVFSADAAVVTLPLGVLQKDLVRFDPLLPADKRNAIRSLRMGVLNKVALRFPVAFWPQEPDFLGYASDAKGVFPTFMNWQKHTSKPVLIAFAGGAFARTLEQKNNSEIAGQVMKVLRTIFGPGIPEPVSVKVTRWSSDPFAFGSYSHIPPGASGDAFDALARPVGMLFFAGEATHRDFPATVHGAYLSGIREASRIGKL